MSHVKLEKVPATKVVLDYEGVFNIDLTMDSGELVGSIKGVGEVSYGGKTSRESIRKEGPCKVTRKSDADQE